MSPKGVTLGNVITHLWHLEDANFSCLGVGFRIFQMLSPGEQIPGVALRLTPGCKPLAPLGRSFFQNGLHVVRQVTISLSEAVLWFCAEFF